MSETYDYYEEQDKKKGSKFVRWIKKSWNDVNDFYEENEGIVNVIALGTTAIVGLVTGISRDRAKIFSLKKEEELKKLYVYDRKFGHYWKIKKPLSNVEWLRINEAVSNGETMGDVLERMNVLSKK